MLAISNQFRPVEYELIDDALMQWETATDSPEAIIYTHDGFQQPAPEDFDYERDWAEGEPTLWRISENDLSYAILDSNAGPGICSVSGGQDRSIAIVYDRQPSAKAWTTSLLHELGHFYGLEHQPTGVMHIPRDEAPDCIDAATLEAWCDLYNCGPNAASTCKED